MAIQLKAEARQGKTKSELHQLRANGKVPAVVYGNQIGNVSIAVDEKQLLALLRSNPHAVVEMVLPDKGKQPVMVNEVQRDKLHRNLLHIDFHQINMNEPVRTTVRVELVGESPGVKEGGILQFQTHELDVRCLPQHLPTAIEADISGLGVGDSLLANELKLPEQVELKTDPNELIVTVLTPQKEVIDETEEAEDKAEAVAEAANEA